jgi:hypothetical protein
MSSHFPPIIDISHSKRAQTHREIDAACRDSREFRARRAAGDYANGREYVEISQYAVRRRF